MDDEHLDEPLLFAAYGADPDTPEGLLIAGHRGFVIIEPCACGTSVELRRGDRVSRVVALHNATEAHEAWRRDQL